ncbi:hypothetical protein [Pteropox virus]|uniref:Uncharacterized protein n=1 Tax=Pteropox virus TaxID=1873698 RepID=A0A1B1MRA6_9POXV|nr:hypothetical protein [Pteropox virus]ANS71118.1 hypothetical protein [Pteropox virus]
MNKRKLLTMIRFSIKLLNTNYSDVLCGKYSLKSVLPRIKKKLVCKYTAQMCNGSESWYYIVLSLFKFVELRKHISCVNCDKKLSPREFASLVNKCVQFLNVYDRYL